MEHLKTERPLLGLSATPFRGGSRQDDTQWLVNRFGCKRYDLDIFGDRDLYSYLQEEKVLSRVDHEELPGVNFEFTDSELANLEATPHFLPAGVENRLGRDVDRNNQILNHILQQPADWPILLFATGVEHAEDIAVQLSMRGIPAQAISSNTDIGQRRFAIKEFQVGRIRVLTNYGVLTTGFDAPSVRAVYITRPVFSKVLYQQMIGRGLRGPQFGGQERCLIVNVADNIAQFGRELAFREFDFLWKPTLR